VPTVCPDFLGGRSSKTDTAASTKYISEELTVSSRPDLSSAGRVVSGGRALKSLENFNKVLDPLADVLGAGTSSLFYLDRS
jgi:electron transfer flavoprotein alpha subunit